MYRQELGYKDPTQELTSQPFARSCPKQTKPLSGDGKSFLAAAGRGLKLEPTGSRFLSCSWERAPWQALAPWLASKEQEGHVVRFALRMSEAT